MKSVCKFFAIVCLWLAVAFTSTGSATAQTGNIFDNFSPYTMYGLGMMNNQATTSKKSMGGVGIASPSIGELNYLNPATLGNIAQRSALFSFGIESQNYYSTSMSKNAFGNEFKAKAVGNIVSLNDVGFAFPITRGVGFSVALTPVSSVGYNSTVIGQESDIIDQIGRVNYSYKGEGGISAVTGSVGVRIAKGLNLGASLIYYFGSIDRYYSAEMAPMLEPQAYSTIKTFDATNISRVGGSFGLQYSFRVSRTGYFTLGATYQLQANMAADREILSMNVGSSFTDTIKMEEVVENIVLPQKYGLGLSFVSDKFEAEVNYTSQDWSNSYNTEQDLTGISLGKQNDYRVGFAFTPNRTDIRKVFNRWTYKVGAHYGQNYMIKDGIRSSQWSVNIGADVPLKLNSPTRLNFGFEYGQRGTINNSTVKESFFKIFLGFSFFGDDMWFEKRKFN